jgi:hypothetical protein
MEMPQLTSICTVSSKSSLYAQNITLVATDTNQSHSGNRIIKTNDTFSRPILLQDNIGLGFKLINQSY